MAETRFAGYHCSHCNAIYPPDPIRYTCPQDGGNLDVLLDYPSLRQRLSHRKIFTSPLPSIWRYAPLLPVNLPTEFLTTPLGAVGHTPVYHLRRLGESLGLSQLWLKDESSNPTASFKDRASAVVIARALDIGHRVIATASTGNAGAALAGLAAAVGIQAIIFVPRSAPQAKLAQLRIFGARISLIDGNYDDAYEASLQACQDLGWYNRNTGYNPFTAEGKKTAAFEIWEWAHHHNPQKRRLTIFVPVGDGNIISGLYKGFYDLEQLGWLDEIGGMPRLIGVQAAGSAAIYYAFHTRAAHITPVQAHTLADSISVNLPRDGYRAIRAVRATDGTYLQVSDHDILQAIATLGSQGIFAEPAAAAAMAGLQQVLAGKAKLSLNTDDPILLLSTGSGLKDVQSAISAAPKPKTAPLYLTG